MFECRVARFREIGRAENALNIQRTSPFDRHAIALGKCATFCFVVRRKQNVLSIDRCAGKEPAITRAIRCRLSAFSQKRSGFWPIANSQ